MDKNSVNLEIMVTASDTSDTMRLALKQIADKNHVILSEAPSDKPWPYIKLAENIVMKAIPTGKMYDLFNDIVFKPESDDLLSLKKRLDAMNSPVVIKTYITQFCPFCPSVVRDMVNLSRFNANINVEIIDGELFSDLAADDKIKSAPTVIFDNKFRWSGSFSLDDFIDAICIPRGDDLSIGAMKKMIESGEASYLADMMVFEKKIFPSFYSVLTDEKWPIRLGGMVTAEHINEKNTVLAGQIIDKLWTLFNHADDSVKGDIVYLTGEIGTRCYMESLEIISREPHHAELIDAALEAIDTLKKRYDRI